MLKISVKIILLLLVFASVSGNYLYSQLQGSGTKSDPYLIFTKDELMQIENHPGTPENLKYFVLKRNIRDSVRTPIKKIENAVFDGQGYKITLAIDDFNQQYHYTVALFCNAVGNVEIKNLVIDGYVNGYFAAGIIGDSKHSKNRINLTNNVNLARITGTNCASGFLHEGFDTLIIDMSINLGYCKAIAVDLPGRPVGGFISHFGFGRDVGELTISNSINSSFLKSNDYVSGFLGLENIYTVWDFPYSKTVLFKSFNTGVLSAKKVFPFLQIRK